MAPRLDIRLKNQLPEIHRLADLVDAFFSDRGLPPKLSYNFNLALDEIITNIVSYGYDDENEHAIDVRAEVIDDAKAYNPLDAKEPDVTADLDDRPIGGLGVFFVKELMDDVRYRYENGRNHFYFCKRTSA